MPGKGPVLLVLINVIVFASAAAAVPLAYSGQIPHLAAYEDTSLVDADLDFKYSPSNCQLSIAHKQTLETTAMESDIWQRLPAAWGEGAYIGGHGDKATYKGREGSAVPVTSRLQVSTGRRGNMIYVSNRVSVRLPREACVWLGSPSHHSG